MSYSQKLSASQNLREIYTQSGQYLGSIYLNYSAQKWAIKEYPGQWFNDEESAKAWLLTKNEPTVKG
jgi:hypothetical protein